MEMSRVRVKVTHEIHDYWSHKNIDDSEVGIRKQVHVSTRNISEQI